MRFKKYVSIIFLVFSFMIYAKEIDLFEEAKINQPINLARHVGDTYKIYVKPLHQVVILFGNEKVEYSETGDNINFNTIEDEHSVRLKVSDENLKTDLFVKTNEDTYYFKVNSSSFMHNNLINFMYPQKEFKIRKKLEKTTEPVLAINLNELNNKYTISKEYSWTPTQIFDDGTKTFFIMPYKIQELPILLITADDQTSTLVTYRIKETEGGMKLFIVDRVFEEGRLILGNNEVIVKNKNFRY